MTIRFLTGLAVAVFAISFFAVNAPAQTPKATKAMDHNDMFQTCAKACSDCQRVCDTCATHCSHMLHEGKKEHMATLAHCLDCANICATASQVAARGGPMSTLICTACADCCAKCAKECDKFTDDKHMTQCAAECRKCEKACRDMSMHAMTK